MRSDELADREDRALWIEPVVIALGRWGSRAPFPPGPAQLGIDSFVMALKTLFDPSAAGGLKARFELRLGDQRFHARINGRRFEITRAGAEYPDAVIEADPASLSAVLWHGRRLGQARRAGEVTIEGSLAAVKRFPELFPPPKPAAA